MNITVNNQQNIHNHSLAGKSSITIQVITTSAQEGLLDGFNRLSERSRYNRFLGQMKRLTPAQLDYLTNLDFYRHMAFCASQDGVGVGVVRCIRNNEKPTHAEAAFTVVDSHQRQGICRLLIGRLAAHAQTVGITTFYGDFLETNEAIHGMAQSMNLETRLVSTGVRHIEMPMQAALDWSNKYKPENSIGITD